MVPNYQRIKQELLQDIERGNYVPDQIFITQQEICQRFQVSRITAERALNDLVRDGILVRRRGQGTFVVETIAPNLVKQVTSGSSPFSDGQNVIACIISVTPSDHKTAIIRGIDQMSREADCHLLFFDSGESAEVEASNLQRAVKAGVMGIILYPVDGLHNSALLASILESDIPIVMVDRYYPTLATDIIVPDNVVAGYEITKLLIAQGHRIIGTLWQEISCTSVQERLIGYKQAIHEARLPIDSEMAMLRSYSGLSEEERRSLLLKWLGLAQPPTAILAANSYTLAIVAMDLLKLGVQIGKDIVLAAMDKDDTSAAPITLSSAGVLLPSHEMGRQAMQVLLNRLQDSTMPMQHLVLPVTLSTPSSVFFNAHMAE